MMIAMTEPRPLSPAEHAVLARLVRALPPPRGQQLLAQLATAKVTGGLPTLLDLEVSRTAAPAEVTDGPLPIRAFVEAADGMVEGELLVWMKDGYLSGLEYAWYSDATPTEMPSPDCVRVTRV
jgi:hypothetical protein